MCRQCVPEREVSEYRSVCMRRKTQPTAPQAMSTSCPLCFCGSPADVFVYLYVCFFHILMGLASSIDSTAT